MKEERNIYLLNELNKGCCMGSDAIKFLNDKINGKEFKNVVDDLLEEYEDFNEKINKIYNKFCVNDPEETSFINKAMTWYGISIRTLKDSSATKIAEMLLQGLNMGIIKGKELLNNNIDADKRIIKLIDEFINIQEKYIEEIKEFL